MKQDYILINGIKYTHLLKEDIYENLIPFPGNQFVVLSQSTLIHQKNSLFYETNHEFITIGSSIVPKDLNINIVPLKFKKTYEWSRWFPTVVLGQYLKLEFKKLNNSYDLFLKVVGPKRSDRKILVEFKDYLLDDANDLIEKMFSCKMPKIEEYKG